MDRQVRVMTVGSRVRRPLLLNYKCFGFYERKLLKPYHSQAQADRINRGTKQSQVRGSLPDKRCSIPSIINDPHEDIELMPRHAEALEPTINVEAGGDSVKYSELEETQILTPDSDCPGLIRRPPIICQPRMSEDYLNHIEEFPENSVNDMGHLLPPRPASTNYSEEGGQSDCFIDCVSKIQECCDRLPCSIM